MSEAKQSDSTVELGALFGAAEKLANNYNDDDRQDIRVDVKNAFFAGAKFGAAAERERCANQVPMNWCDPLLTGPKSVVPATVDCRAIERLLQGVQARIRGAELDIADSLTIFATQ